MSATPLFSAIIQSQVNQHVHVSATLRLGCTVYSYVSESPWPLRVMYFNRASCMQLQHLEADTYIKRQN